ncbi:glycosyl hydrolase family 18 protein [Laceyella putida]|uniref:Glycosyl hydrolase family 18 protein n=1 Tax=Laceyella putida TaxID=110101 RepID=A0ABW2RI64_9BACL
MTNQTKKIAIIAGAIGALALIGGGIFYFANAESEKTAAKTTQAPVAKIEESTEDYNDDTNVELAEEADVTHTNTPAEKKQVQRQIQKILVAHNNVPNNANRNTRPTPTAPSGSEGTHDSTQTGNGTKPAPTAPAGQVKPGEQPQPTPQPAKPTEKPPAVKPVPLPAPLPDKSTQPTTKPTEKPAQPQPQPNKPPTQPQPNKPPTQPPAEKPTNPTEPGEVKEQGLQVTAWYPFWGGKAAQTAVAQQPIKKIDLFYYELKEDGTVGLMQYAKPVSQEVLTAARQKGVQINATITNAGGWSNFNEGANRLHEQISTPAARSKLTDTLVQFAITNKFDGLDINFEVIYGKDRDNFSLFMEELSAKLHKHNKKLSICAYVKFSEPGNWDGNLAQDWKRLGQAVDEFKVMAYNYSMASPGPGAPVNWLDQIIQFGKKQMPAKKLFIGLPSYSYEWNLNTGQRYTVTYATAQNLIKKYNVTQIKRDENGEPYFTYNNDKGEPFKTYFQDATSWKKKIEMIKTKHADIGGISNWYLGAEDPATWHVVKSELK